MAVVLITGSAGLIGSESCYYYSQRGFDIVGVDNNMRERLFGKEGSIALTLKGLQKRIKNYQHYSFDIRSSVGLSRVFKKYQKNIKLIIHTAAQPSHDWAADHVQTDFAINANGTLNMLELARMFSPDAVFVYTSTNKVYGDLPNQLPLIEKAKRYDLPLSHKFYQGIDESMSIDYSLHSLFGASKLSADILVQEFGRYFGMKTGVFRAGCLTGSRHAATQQHGFLSYLVKCALLGQKYTVIGYKGKQVRDNIHSYDVITAFDAFFKKPLRGEVFNLGGGRENSCSILEAVNLVEKISGKKMKLSFDRKTRRGDHQWYISSTKKFQQFYPQWKKEHSLQSIFTQMIDSRI